MNCAAHSHDPERTLGRVVAASEEGAAEALVRVEAGWGWAVED
jgi:hypothetical protein